MGKYIFKRILMMIPVLIGVSILVFLIQAFTPGDPADLVLGAQQSEETKYIWRDKYDLNDNIVVQYGKYMYLDFDGDGERELLVLSPFHGDTLTIQKKLDGSFKEVYRHEKRLPFLHAIWGAEIGGKVYGFIGNREESRDLLAIYWDGRNYTFDMLDQGAGAANVLHFRRDGQDLLLAANRETDEIAVYTLDAEG